MSIIKEVNFQEDAKSPLIEGINIMGRAVGSTMGYRGRTVLVESSGGKPIVTKDGVSVAESIFLEDPIQSLGCEFVKDACRKTVSSAGDGTTQTTVLIREIVNVCDKLLKENKDSITAIDLKNYIEKELPIVIEHLVENSIEVTEDKLFDVARISANNDDELGSIISEAFIKAGKNGVVSYEQSDNATTYIDFIDGMPIARGWEFEGFINKPESRSIEFANEPFILLSYRKLTHIKEILPILEYIHSKNKELLIVSEMEHSVMQTLYANKKGGLKVGIINPPSIGEKRRDYLSDISLSTGAMVIDIDTSNNIDGYDPEELLGVCSKITVTKDDTVLFFKERSNTEGVNAKIKELSAVIKTSNNKLEKEYLQDRISKLACGVSVIKVGGNTEVETKEKIDRVDDAIHAVRAALDMGVVAGGGVALLKAGEELRNGTLIGDILADVCSAPIKTILSNAGLKESDIESNIKSILKTKAYSIGYDVKNYELTDMFESGIIDPLKVIVTALENAISASMTIITTDTTITFKRV